MSGQMSASQTVEFITRFEESFNTGDIDALMDAMTDDTVFEHVAPPALSFGRYEGHAAVRAAWESLPAPFPRCHFRVDDVFASGDRCTCRYTLTYDNAMGGRESRAGVDVFRLRGGRICEKLTYLTL